MTAKDALKLITGQKIREKSTGRVMTVVLVISEATDEYPSGIFPRVVTHERGAMSYLALRLESKDVGNCQEALTRRVR